MNFISSSYDSTDTSEDTWRDRSARYLDRCCSPDETVKRVSRHFSHLGITRIADQTNLDRIGIPCFASFRPNAKTLANNQGKGLTADAARASAVMEAAEFGIAENPQVPLLIASIDQMRLEKKLLVDFKSVLPENAEIDTTRSIRWVKGHKVSTGERYFIPVDAVDMNFSEIDLRRVCKTTNGLASGNIDDEAIFHGLCELIERDAGTLWSFRDMASKANTAIDPTSLQDEEVTKLAKKIDDADLKLVLFDQTSDIGTPCIMALIGDPSLSKPTHFDLAAGYGVHPNAARAAIRAITEAAQTRITSIAASRDDIDPASYSQYAPDEHLNLLSIDAPSGNRAPTGLPNNTPLADLLTATKQALADVGIQDIFAFPLCGKEFCFSVFKLVIPELEDREANFHWRPKARALKVLRST